MRKLVRTLQMTGRRRLPNARSLGGSASRQTLAVVAIGVALALGALAFQEFSARQSAAAAAQWAKADAAGNDEIYTGSIVYMPDEGGTCHQMLFDNQTGRFTDNGYVDCEGALYHGTDGPKQWSTDRLHVISAGFRR
jgi:hypothetical protein